MMNPMPRRRFLRATGASMAALSTFSLWSAENPPNRRLRVAVMGLGRGLDHVRALLELPGVEIAWLCDVDTRRTDRAAETVAKQTNYRPQGQKDIRKVLEDKTTDALFIAAPNFWHTPATVLACAAGKHVYVEKPGSGTAQESQMIVAAARKYGRLVQMGNQRRSFPGIIEGMNRLREGVIGRVITARCWYTNSRGSIGRGQPAAVPEWLDYSLWQGPVPERPYKDNLVHYNWHWMWHWGNGELGNNGVHYLDLARWGLGVDAPRQVACTGGRYHFNDDQETPDTGVVTYDFGHCYATWEWSSCHPRPTEKYGLVHFYGEKGSLIFEGAGYRILDMKGVEVAKGSGPAGDKVHIGNFLDAIRGDAKLTSEIAEAQKSALLCHLGNIAWRVGRTLRYDAAQERIVDDAQAMKLWQREYRPGWAPKV
ncbi:Gfo/Idh/MocA family oxidoreductase [Fontisphaera persica]|uniref:Gfo/Idh/MocA family protein n=1 Tax=Fontisphaera persica TaxID=2974023 RepID=UPI0031B82762